MTQPVPPILYKYMSESRIGFFDNPQLLFTFPEFFNDIFDCEPRIQGLIRPDFVKEKVEATREKILTEHPDFIPALHKAMRQVMQEFLNSAHDDDKFEENFGEFFSSYDNLIKIIKDTSPNNDTSELSQLRKEDLVQLLEDINNYGQKYFTEESFSEWIDAMPALMAELTPSLEASQLDKKKEFLQNINSWIKNKNIGVLCLTEDNLSNNMWGLYASEHAGFAVGIDTDNTIFHKSIVIDVPLWKLDKVSYKPTKDLAYLTDYFPKSELQRYKFFHDLIFTKDNQWEYEQEWRIAISTPKHLKSIPRGILISVFPSIVKSVHLGARASSALQKKASTFCTKHGIPLFKISPADWKLEDSLVPLD